jgi:GTP-binding protein
VVRDEHGTPVADLVAPGDELVVSPGGRGGRGNAAFRTSQRRAPRFHERGEPPTERSIRLELKLAADVALVGFPNVGKSSLIARLSAARPKIADYAFTTLSPNLGVVQVDEVDFVVADVPGLIGGASEGRGLGRAFLRHVERALVLVHVLDCASHEQRDPREDLATVVAELERYGREAMDDSALPPLIERPALVFLNKVDADPETAEIIRPDLEADGWEVLEGSAVTGEGLDSLRRRLAALVVEVRETRGPDRTVRHRPVLRPTGSAGAPDFEVHAVEDGWRVTGPRIERWVRMLDLENAEAVRYLQGRLERAGVERALAAAGAEPGDAVDIAGHVFDYNPDLPPDPDDQEGPEA